MESAPDDPELLLLAGWLHDRPNLNDPPAAARYYQRLADLGDNPSARLAGLLALCYHHCHEGRPAEANDLVRRIDEEFYGDASAAPSPQYRELKRKIEAALGDGPAMQ